MPIEKPPVLSLSGFELRPLVRTDLPAWFAYLSIPKVVEHTSWALRSVEDLESVFEGYESKELNSARRMAIVRRSRHFDWDHRLSLGLARGSSGGNCL